MTMTTTRRALLSAAPALAAASSMPADAAAAGDDPIFAAIACHREAMKRDHETGRRHHDARIADGGDRRFRQALDEARDRDDEAVRDAAREAYETWLEQPAIRDTSEAWNAAALRLEHARTALAATRARTPAGVAAALRHYADIMEIMNDPGDQVEFRSETLECHDWFDAETAAFLRGLADTLDGGSAS